MLITYNGHSEFLLQTADGQRILIDPYDPQAGYPMKRQQADLVCISHHHFDHNHLQVWTAVRGGGHRGRHHPLPASPSPAPAFHDDERAPKGRLLCL